MSIKTVDLAMTGAGTRGACYAGFISHLENNEVKIRRIVGGSIGATIGIMYSCLQLSGTRIDVLKEIFSDLSFQSLVSMQPYKSQSIWDPSKFKNVFSKVIDPTITLGYLNKFSIPIGVMFNRHNSLFLLSDSDVLAIDAAVYAMSYPKLLPPMVYQGEVLYDVDSIFNIKYFGADWLICEAKRNHQERVEIIGLTLDLNYGLISNLLLKGLYNPKPNYVDIKSVDRVIQFSWPYSPITFWHMKRGFELGTRVTLS